MADILASPVPHAGKPPAPTLPEAEAAFLHAAYAEAGIILEYGSGGSTVMAAGLPGKVIFSVESDRKWMAGLQSWFDANPTPSKPVLHHGDIGTTGHWGHPAGEKQWAKFHRYPLSVWDRSDFVHPDVVLIDGRFRAACYLAVLFRAQRPVTVYFDDYGDRPEYHDIERYGAPSRIVGRMARFDVTPMVIPAGDLAFIMDVFTRKQ